MENIPLRAGLYMLLAYRVEVRQRMGGAAAPVRRGVPSLLILASPHDGAQHNLRGHPIGNLGLETAWAATACASALFGVEEVELDAMGVPDSRVFGVSLDSRSARRRHRSRRRGRC